MSERSGARKDILTQPEGPRVVAGGVVVSGGRGRRRTPPRKPILLGLASAAVSAFLVLATGLLGSCAGSATLGLRGDGGLHLQVEAAVPPALSSRLRGLSGLPASTALFDAEAARKASLSQPGLKLSTFATPGPDALSATMDIADLQAFLAEPGIAATHAAVLTSGGGWKELRVHLERGSCAPLLALLPGLDPELLEALSPPALDPEPISRAEYRRSLAGIVGEKAMVAVEGASFVLRLSAPGSVLASSGGKLEGQTLVVSLPALDLLVLEKPIEFSIRWKT
jgi:hypothetical protein